MLGCAHDCVPIKLSHPRRDGKVNGAAWHVGLPRAPGPCIWSSAFQAGSREIRREAPRVVGPVGTTKLHRGDRNVWIGLTCASKYVILQACADRREVAALRGAKLWPDVNQGVHGVVSLSDSNESDLRVRSGSLSAS